MKKLILLLGCFILFLSFNLSLFSQEKFFKNPKNTYLISTDLHIHTVFSDGFVWPDLRVDEALREGLDLISITDHLEYQPHKGEILNPDKNRSFEIANKFAQGKELNVVLGAEITRSMPPGHLNAVFITDANLLLHKDSISGIIEANKQNAFVFMNHPNWWPGRPSGIARLEPIHEELIKKKFIHGIEVVNVGLSIEALEIAIENNLTILGTSDVHGIATWEFEQYGGHRPITFVLSEGNDLKSVKNGLFEGKTMVWYKDLIIGKQENLLPVIDSNLEFSQPTYIENTKIASVNLLNLSSIPLILNYNGKFTLHEDDKIFIIPPRGSKEIKIKTIELLKKINVNFEIFNAIIGKDQYLMFSKTLNFQ